MAEAYYDFAAARGVALSVILLADRPTSELISVSEHLHTDYSPDCD